MSNILTQLSSSSIAMDMCCIILVSAAIAADASMLKMFAAKRMRDDGSLNVSMFFIIVASIPFTLAFAISLALSVATSVSFSDAQAVPIGLTSAAGVAIFFINLVRDLLCNEEENSRVSE